MTEKSEPACDWELTTWKGSRREQHRRFHALPFARKLEVIEEMGELAAQFGNKKAGQSASSMPAGNKPCSQGRGQGRSES